MYKHIKREDGTRTALETPNSLNGKQKLFVSKNHCRSIAEF